MKWYILLTFIFTCTLRTVFANGTNFAYTYAMATHCKEHVSQNGYTYDQFYSIYADDMRKLKFGKGVVLEMHVAIQAASNGHILLSPISLPTHNDSVYEIVVGGGGNKFTELRRNLKRNAKASKTTIGILSAVELRGFSIKQYNSGLIEFSEEGADLPILSFMDMDPLEIKYFSFASWSGVEAKFLYDCPASGDNTNQTVPDSRAVERPLSNSDRLKKELLQDRPSHLAPGPDVEVSLGVLIAGVSYDAFDSMLTTRVMLITFWRDESLSWYPDKFNNITDISFRQGQVWRPLLHIFNSDSLDALETTGHEVVSMLSTGEATFHFKTVIDTWCYTEPEGFNRWPHDTYSCSIVIQPWEAHEKISFTALNESASILKKVIDTEEVTLNEWKIMNVSQIVVSSKMWNAMYPSMNNVTHQSDRLVIQLDIERRAASYNIVFYTPLLVLMAFVLMSFWNEPLQMSRVWFYAGACIVICAGLCYIEYMIPCHTVPSILVLYITVLGCILISLMLNVVLMTSITEKFCKTMFMQNILSARCFRTLFCLPVVKVCRNYNTINEGFLSQEEDSSDPMPSSANGNVEEMQEDNTKYCEKEEIAEALDKTMFVVYSLVFAIMLGLHY